MKKLLAAPFLAVCLAGAAPAARADVTVFAFEAHSSYSHREVGSSPGSYLSGIARDWTIGSISVLNDLFSDGALKFVIFDHASGALLYESAPKAFVDDGLTWKRSDPLSFTLLAGRQYDVGAVANVGGDWAYDIWESYTQNGITQRVGNANFFGFAPPDLAEHTHASAIIPLRLTSPVPEAPAGAMFGAGLALVGLLSAAGQRRRAACGARAGRSGAR